MARATAALEPRKQVAAFEDAVSKPFAPLYEADVIGIAAGSERDASIVASLAAIRANAMAPQTKEAVAARLPKVATLLSGSFPDFRCDFPIYLMDALGQLDGAGRVVAGRPSLVIGVDMLARENPRQLPVFLAHEFFHRYHWRAAGFSDDAGDKQALWRVLWAEGLATYVSLKLTPDATLPDALLLPADLEERARPRLAEISRRLLSGLGQVDPATYKLLFTYGNKEAPAAGLPWRSGYYAGYCVAHELGRTRSIDALAHLSGAPLYDLIAATLAGFENAPPSSDLCKRSK